MTAGQSSWLVKWPIAHVVSWEGPGSLRASWELTKADISAGFRGTPMTLAQLQAKYGSGLRMACRPIQRHGIAQGQKQPSSSRSSLQS